MRYAIEQCPNADVIQIHVDFDIPRFFAEEYWTRDTFDRLDDEDESFVRRLIAVVGVTSASGSDYRFQIGKGRLFTWEQLVPEILEVIQERFSPNAEMVAVSVERRAYR